MVFPVSQKLPGILNSKKHIFWDMAVIVLHASVQNPSPCPNRIIAKKKLEKMAFLSMLLSSNVSCKAIPAICVASCHTRLISHDCWYKISVSSEAVLTCSSIDIAILSSFDNLTMVDRTKELSPFCHILIALVMPCISFPSPFCSLTRIICTRDHSSQASVPWLDFSYFFSPGACPFWMMLLLWIDPYDPRVIWRTPNTS